MDSPASQPPLCLACRYRAEHPCRPGGLFDADHVAHVLATYIEATSVQPSDRTRRLQAEWANDCAVELAFHSPDTAFRVVLLAMIELETPQQALLLATGTLETLVATHGPRFIDQIEMLATQSPRFRYLLSLIWPQGKKASPTWQRIELARMGAPRPGPDDPLPPVGMIAQVF